MHIVGYDIGTGGHEPTRRMRETLGRLVCVEGPGPCGRAAMLPKARLLVKVLLERVPTDARGRH